MADNFLVAYIIKYCCRPITLEYRIVFMAYQDDMSASFKIFTSDRIV